jgi:hypothetical protein
MPRFSYTTTFLPCPYIGTGGFIRSEVSLLPNIDGFFENKQHAQHLTEMGEAGWELVSTEAVLRAAHEMGKFDDTRGTFPVTAGFFLFWKRSK